MWKSKFIETKVSWWVLGAREEGGAGVSGTASRKMKFWRWPISQDGFAYFTTRK